MHKHTQLILAFAIPILFIIGVAVVVMAPQAPVETSYNFIYATCDSPGGYCAEELYGQFEVHDGKFVTGEEYTGVSKEISARIYLHNTTTNVSEEITVKDAQTLSLSALTTSPDGVTFDFQYNRSPDVFPFYGGQRSYDYVLSKGKADTKLNLVGDDTNYWHRENIEFIGWVIQN